MIDQRPMRNPELPALTAKVKETNDKVRAVLTSGHATAHEMHDAVDDFRDALQALRQAPFPGDIENTVLLGLMATNLDDYEAKVKRQEAEEARHEARFLEDGSKP